MRRFLVVLALAAGCAPALRQPSPPARPHYADPSTIFIEGTDTVRYTRSRPKPGDPVRIRSAAPMTPGTAVVAFVIGVDGKVELPTIAFIESDVPARERWLCEFFMRAEYLPAMKDGVPQRTLVLVPFRSSLVGREAREPDMNTHQRYLQVTPREEVLAAFSEFRGCGGRR